MTERDELRIVRAEIGDAEYGYSPEMKTWLGGFYARRVPIQHVDELIDEIRKRHSISTPSRKLRLSLQKEAREALAAYHARRQSHGT